jgi:DNA-binding XRE family transcriptional regulator
LLPSLASLGATPSQQESLLLQAQGAGVSVHLLSLMSPVEQHLPGIREGWQASAQLEGELKRTRERMAEREVQFQEEMQQFQDEVFARATAAFGSKQLVSKIKEEQSPIGTFIRQRREALGLSQAQLAERIGIGRSSIQRAETDGTSDSLTAILAAVTDNSKALERQDGVS